MSSWALLVAPPLIDCQKKALVSGDIFAATHVEIRPRPLWVACIRRPTARFAWVAPMGKETAPFTAVPRSARPIPPRHASITRLGYGGSCPPAQQFPPRESPFSPGSVFGVWLFSFAPVRSSVPATSGPAACLLLTPCCAPACDALRFPSHRCTCSVTRSCSSSSTSSHEAAV